MQQHDSNFLNCGKEQRLNRSKREEMVPRYKSASPPSYEIKHEDEEQKEKA
jgi:hypothetical protein